MDKQRQQEYDFFQRAALLFEDRAATLAKKAEKDLATEEIYRRNLRDAQNARLWAERIRAGWKMVEGAAKGGNSQEIDTLYNAALGLASRVVEEEAMGAEPDDEGYLEIRLHKDEVEKFISIVYNWKREESADGS